MKTPEGKVKDAVKAWLNKHSAWWYMVVPTGYSRAGVPDFLACIAGQLVAIETKAPGKRANLSPNQKREIRGIVAAGGIALVVDDVAQLDTYLGGLVHDSQPQAPQAGAAATKSEESSQPVTDSKADRVQRPTARRRTASHRRNARAEESGF